MRNIRLLIVVVIFMLGACSALIYQHFKAKPALPHYFPSNITKELVGIPVYYPANLPNGYTASDFKVIKKDIIGYLVTSPRGEKFNVVIQPLPSNFDFVGFKKKFVKPDEYPLPFGNALVGVAGGDLIGSIQTTDSSWIILNSKEIDSIKDMETITRSLVKSEL